MRVSKFNGVLGEIAEKYPQIDLVEFLEDRLQLPPYKAEKLAVRIERQFSKGKTDLEPSAVRRILEVPGKLEAQSNVGGYSVDVLSAKEFDHFVQWLLEALGYSIESEKRMADGSVDLVAVEVEAETMFLARRVPKNCKIIESILLLAEQAKQIYACSKVVILATAYFSRQTIAAAEKAGVELWDHDELNRKIVEAKKNLTTAEQSRLPQYQGTLLQSLLKLDETAAFIVEPRASGKYDVHLPGVKFPLLTFQAQGGVVVQCVCRIKNNMPVSEIEGTVIISSDHNGSRLGPGDAEAYVSIMQYLEEFLE